MKKAILTTALLLLVFGSMHAQIISALQLTTSVTVANACTPPCDGTATVKAGGGTPPYTYNWSTTPTQTTPTATGLCPGTYTVLVNDANVGIPNYATATVTITCNGGGTVGSLSVAITPTNANTCVAPCDGAAAASVTGGTPPYTFAWSTIPVQSTQNATGLCPGTYTLVVVDAATIPNQTTKTVSISCNGINPGTLAVTTTVTAATNCTAPCNGTATAIPAGGTPPYIYAWATIPVQTTQTATGLCPGTYSVTVMDSGSGVSSAKGTATVTCNTANGIGSVFLSDNISLFPNPANNVLNLQFSVAMDQVRISVRGVLGAELMLESFEVKGSFTKVIDIAALPAGIFNLEIVTNEAMITKQFIKQ